MAGVTFWRYGFGEEKWVQPISSMKDVMDCEGNGCMKVMDVRSMVIS